MADRLPPQNIEAEQSVLGSLLIDPDAVIKISTFLQPEDFYRETHQMIYSAILGLHERRLPADFVTLVDDLTRQGQTEIVGGASYLSSLINSVPTSIHVEHYAHIVERSAIMRRLISAAGEIASLAYREQGEIDEVIDQAEQILFEVSHRRVSKSLVPMKEIVRRYYERIEFLVEHQDQTMGVPTGLIDLDRLMGGLQPSDLIIIASRPGVGKSSLALTIAANAALKNDSVVALFTLEMAAEQLVQRMISGRTGIDAQRLRLGQHRRHGVGAVHPGEQRTLRGGHLYRRHAVALADGDTHQGAPSGGRVRSGPDHHRLSATDAGRRPVRAKTASRRSRTSRARSRAWPASWMCPSSPSRSSRAPSRAARQATDSVGPA